MQTTVLPMFNWAEYRLLKHPSQRCRLVIFNGFASSSGTNSILGAVWILFVFPINLSNTNLNQVQDI
ncbi:MAG: hypothetical protein QM734_00425, partial [Cyclobacteriaceae bacterium]